MDISMKKRLTAAVKEYGQTEYICSADALEKNWERWTASDRVTVSEASDLHIRSRVIGLGRILEEDLEKHVYVMLVKAGKNEALVVTHTTGMNVDIAACAREGLINQHIAKKAVDHVKSMLLK